jgi:hypothetical protein
MIAHEPTTAAIGEPIQTSYGGGVVTQVYGWVREVATGERRQLVTVKLNTPFKGDGGMVYHVEGLVTEVRG